MTAEELAGLVIRFTRCDRNASRHVYVAMRAAVDGDREYAAKCLRRAADEVERCE